VDCQPDVFTRNIGRIIADGNIVYAGSYPVSVSLNYITAEKTMNEKTLRIVHRKSGLVLAVFIVVQALTGIALSVEGLLGAYWGGMIKDLHFRMGLIGGLYRIALGAGLVWMVLSGMMIYARIRARIKPGPSHPDT